MLFIIPPSVKDVTVRLAQPDERRAFKCRPRARWIGWRQSEQFRACT